METGIIKQSHTEPTATVTAALFDEFSRYLDVPSKRTAELYCWNVMRFLEWLDVHGITQPTRADVLAYRDEMKATHTAATVRLQVYALRRFFSWTESAGRYANIARGVKAPNVKAGHKRDALTAEQVKNLLNGIDRTTLAGARDYAMLRLMVAAGLRDTEVTTADDNDLRHIGTVPVIVVMGKGHTEKDDYVRLDPKTYKAIREYQRRRNAVQGLKNGPIFVSLSNSNRGERLTTRSVSKIVKTHMLDAGLDSDRWTAHSLRHTAVTLALESGARLDAARQFARHANLQTTLTYVHDIEQLNNECSRLIASAIDGVAGV